MTCEDPKVVDLITGYKNFFYIDNKSLFMKRKETMYSALVTKTNKSKRRTNRHKEIEIHCINPQIQDHSRGWPPL